MQLSVEFLSLVDACAKTAPFVKVASPPTIDYRDEPEINRDDLVYEAGKLNGSIANQDTWSGLFGGDYSENRARMLDAETAARKRLAQLKRLELDDEDNERLVKMYTQARDNAAIRRQQIDSNSPIHNIWRDSWFQKAKNLITGNGWEGETELYKKQKPSLYAPPKAWDVAEPEED